MAEHRRDLLPAVDPAQLDLPACHETEEQDQRRVLARQRALRLHASAKFLVELRNVVRRRYVFHGALGKLKNVRSSSPPSRRLPTTPGQRLAHVRSNVT